MFSILNFQKLMQAVVVFQVFLEVRSSAFPNSGYAGLWSAEINWIFIL